MNTDKIQDKEIYKSNEKLNSSVNTEKTGNTELDKGLSILRYNSMPSWAKIGGSE